MLSWIIKEDDSRKMPPSQYKAVQKVPEESYFERGRSPYLKSNNWRCDVEESSEPKLSASY